MTETLDPMDQLKMDHQQLAQQLLAQARAGGVELVGPNGLLNQLTANVLEPALDAEMDEHLGYEKHHVKGRNAGKRATSENGAQGDRPGRDRS
nr:MULTISPECIES: transposase [Rhodococcus]